MEDDDQDDDQELELLLGDMGLPRDGELRRARRRRVLEGRKKNEPTTHVAVMACGRCHHVIRTVPFNVAPDGHFALTGLPDTCPEPQCMTHFKLAGVSVKVTIYRKMNYYDG